MCMYGGLCARVYVLVPEEHAPTRHEDGVPGDPQHSEYDEVQQHHHLSKTGTVNTKHSTWNLVAHNKYY